VRFTFIDAAHNCKDDGTDPCNAQKNEDHLYKSESVIDVRFFGGTAAAAAAAAASF